MLVAINFTKNPQRLARLHEQLRHHLGAELARLTLAVTPEQFAAHLPEAEVVATYRLSAAQFALCRRLRWLHVGGAGVEKSLSPELVRSAVVVTNARGIHGDRMAEYVLGVLLYWANGLDLAVRSQRERVWRQGEIVRNRFTLAGRTVAIAGMGAVGCAIAQTCSALGMRVVGLQRHTPAALPPGVAQVYTPAQSEALLRQADFLVLALPLTAATRNWLDAGRMAWLKPRAFLINVGRGGLVQEAALLEALRTGRLAGAALDVFRKEPLPADHPLWTMDRVLVTPHISGNFEEYVARAGEQFAENLARYVRGEPLLNVVDKERGY